ncbi:MAG: MMPL family transporter, partial [Cupriavidus necator]
LSAALKQLATADAATRDRAERAIAVPLQLALARLKLALDPQPVSQQTLPPELVRDWITPDGRALVNVSPKLPPPASAQREAALDRFITAVQRVEPTATGGPIAIRGSADTIMAAFTQAGVWAVVSITILLWITLRRFGDVLRTLIPLLVSAIVTLELCVLFGIALNFANVIALPLLLGVGVAFKIYYVIAWRHGKTQLLQSSLTHAVLYSAATTATAFGSLWLSQHPGTASMGKLLALALACTLVGAVFFQPILMGRPREGAHHKHDKAARS